MNLVQHGETIDIWFSCGAASAVAAKKTIEKYGDICTIRVINSPIKEEHKDNRRFLKAVEKWLGQKVEIATNKKFPSGSAVAVWKKRKYMSGVSGAPCTLKLKKEARYQWEKDHPADWHVLGFTADEKKRHDLFVIAERSNVIPVLIDEGITKKDCFKILKEAGIEIPEIYKLGAPNANCIGCVKATSPTYWNWVRRFFPKVFLSRAKQSKKIGCRLVRVKGKRKFLDELLPTDKGRSMKNMDFECGIFCALPKISKK